MAESSLTEEQRKDYGRIFLQSDQAKLPPAAPALEASFEERIQALRAQEKRLSVPGDINRFKEYLANRAQMKMLEHLPPGQQLVLFYLLNWNHVALDATSLDHTNNGTPEHPSPTFGEQLGPARTSRALAIVHLAMFEAVNTISRKYESYNGLQEVIVKNAGIPKEMITADQVSINSAIVEAAYETLKALYPKKTPFFDNAHDLDYTQLHGSMSSLLGEEIGRQAAKAVLALRANDGSELPDLSASDFDSNNPNTWHQDPITQLKPALGGNWFRVKPFEIASADAFLPKPPPLIGSADFVEPYKKVKRLGSDPHAVASGTRWPTQTVRTGAASPNNPVPADNTNQTFVGIFWAYDGTPSLCAPPRLYNMIATSVALNEVPISTVEDMSCYLAFINICLADAGIAAWNAKYHYLYPRPITVIRALSADSTPEGASDSRWTPLGGQVSNGPDSSKNLTPNFPSYPSGHATFGGALFRAMYRFLRTPPEGVKFHFISDEYNGLNRGLGESQPRQLAPADFQSFKEAEYLNAESRVYLGIHWEFDATEGIIQGNLISDDIYPKFVRPTH